MARKRFGRNQKRRLREEAKKWREAYERDHHVAREAIGRFERVKNAIENVSKNSALLDPEVIPSKHKMDCWMISRIINDSDLSVCSPAAEPTPVTIKRVRLDECIVYTAINNYGMHVILKHDDLSVGYGLSWMMTREVLDHPEYHVHEIARMIAMEIARVKREGFVSFGASERREGLGGE